MKKRWMTVVLIAVLVLSGCGKTKLPATGEDVAKTETTTQKQTTEQEVTTLADPSAGQSVSTGDFMISGGTVSVDGSTFTITSAGEYTLTGTLTDGQVIVKAGEDDKVVLVLDGASITSAAGAPILSVSADTVEVSAAEGSYNEVTDARDASVADAENYDGAIYADCDLKLTGAGTLVVTSSYENGVKSKDDVTIKDLTLKVTAPGNAVKGNDSVKIKSGKVILVSTGSDAIKTSNSDVSKKGNQKGSITIEGGQVDLYAACDGIDAAYDVNVSGEDTALNIFTASYSSESGEVSVGEDFYLVIPKSLYSDQYDYYAYFYHDSDGTWIKSTYETMVYSGRNASYYGMALKKPAGYASLAVYAVKSGEEPSFESFIASTEGETINASMNAFVITGQSGDTFSGDWAQLTNDDERGGSSSNKTSYSSKGIKAANEVLLCGGTITIYAMDDGVHANEGDALDNGEKGAGNVTVSGTTKLQVTAADDGIHADNTLTIDLAQSGSLKIVDSHEGLEANVIHIVDGMVSVYGDDDGMNACAGDSRPLIQIDGGTVTVRTPSGDTDAIDSNGNFVMTGGDVLVLGGSSSGNMAGSVDVDGTIQVTGGTIVALGGICETPESGSVNTYVSSGTQFAAGSYALVDSNNQVLWVFTTEETYSSIWIASDQLTLGDFYAVTYNGSELLSWTQSSSLEGSSGNWGGGFGGPGGGMPGGGGGNPGGMGRPGGGHRP